jgi:MFS family permease
VRRFLATIYAFKVFDSFILIFPLYAVMFVDAGLTPVQISIVLMVWSGVTFVMQAPAGVLADRWPRRYVLATAQATLAACFVVWWLDPHFWGFLIGLALWGLKSALTGGTFEALLYDELKAAGRAMEYPRYYGRCRAIQAGAVVAASGGAALAARFGYGVALEASIAAVAISAGTALLMPPAARALATSDRDYLSHLRQGLGFAFTDRTVLGILAFSAVVVALGAPLEEFWPIFGAKVGLSRPLIAVFVGGQQTIQALASLSAHRLAGIGRRWFYGLFCLIGAMLLAAAGLFSAPAMALLALYSGAIRLIDVSFEGRLQHAIPSGNRATIGSVKALATQIGIWALYLVMGPLAQATSYRTAFAACGVAGALIGAACLLGSARRPQAAG